MVLDSNPQCSFGRWLGAATRHVGVVLIVESLCIYDALTRNELLDLRFRSARTRDEARSITQQCTLKTDRIHWLNTHMMLAEILTLDRWNLPAFRSSGDVLWICEQNTLTRHIFSCFTHSFQCRTRHWLKMFVHITSSMLHAQCVS